MPAVPSDKNGPLGAGFVSLAITTEPQEAADALPVPEPVTATSQVVKVEIGVDLVMRVPSDVPDDRVPPWCGRCERRHDRHRPTVTDPIRDADGGLPLWEPYAGIDGTDGVEA